MKKILTLIFCALFALLPLSAGRDRGVVRGGGGLSAGGGRRSVGPGAPVLAPGGRRSAGGSAGGRSGGRLAAAGQGGQQSGRRQGERKGAFHKSCTPFRWGPQGTGYLHFSGPSEKMQPQDKATVPPAPCGGCVADNFPGNKEGRLSQAALGSGFTSAGRRHTRCPCSWWESCRSSPR